MSFNEKFKKAMQDLHLTQRAVCDLTGKSKASVSQYVSGKQVPSEMVQSDIAVSLGLNPDYFKDSPKPVKPVRYKGTIQRMDVCEAARLLGINPVTVRKGLQQGVFPWGYGIHTSENKWTYFINARRFAEIEGLKGEEI